MEYESLRKRVCSANKSLASHGLVTFTWGNVSEVDREEGVFAIKPSGVAYDVLQPEDIVVLNFEGQVVAGEWNPSSDTKTHLELYKAFSGTNGIVHTHSPYAVAWAQAGRDIPCYGTTHADYFYGAIPCARGLTQAEIEQDYEKHTGSVIIETFCSRNIDPVHVPGIICQSHGPFTWGKDAEEAVYYAVVLEEVAKMAILTREIGCDVQPASQWIQDKHFKRKHGSLAYYGQRR